MKKILMASLLMLLPFVANAGAVLCSDYATSNGVADVSNRLSPSFGCNVGSTNNDFVSNPLQVNQDEMFGFDDWHYGLKYDYDSASFEYGVLQNDDLIESVQIGSGKLSGNVVFDDVLSIMFPNLSDAMIVIKGGQGNNTYSEYVGYSIDLAHSEFSWDTPFNNLNGNGNAKGISHWTLYGRGGDPFSLASVDPDPPANVPEPSTLIMFALAGLGLISARRKKIL